MKDNVIKVLKVEPKKKPEICLIKNELKSLQEAVSIGADHTGLIEIIGLDVGTCLLCNEEGKRIGLEPNRRLGNDIICGVFYILGEDENGVLKSLSEEDAEYYAEYTANFDDCLAVEIHNKGMGLLRIDNAFFTDSKGEKCSNLYEFIKDEQGISYNLIGTNKVLMPREKLYSIKFDNFTQEQRSGYFFVNNTSFHLIRIDIIRIKCYNSK